MCRRKALRGSAEDFLEFAAKMGFISKFQLVCRSFIGISLGDEVLGESTLKFPQPVAGSAVQMLAEQALQLTLGNGAKRGHFRGIEISLPRHLFPLLNCQEAPIHMQSH